MTRDFLFPGIEEGRRHNQKGSNSGVLQQMQQSLQRAGGRAAEKAEKIE